MKTEKFFDYQFLSPYSLDGLIRVGSKNDGGYIVTKQLVNKTKYLVGFGISTNWDFEQVFKNLNKNILVFGFDYSVSKMGFLKTFLRQLIRKPFNSNHYSALKIFISFSFFFNNKSAYFFKKGISDSIAGEFIDINTVFKIIDKSILPNRLVNNNLAFFFKIDIEQSEYRILEDLINYESYINGMVVEFHDLDILWDTFKENILMIQEYFYVYHIHANNAGGKIKGTPYAKILEISFINKKFVAENSIDIHKKNIKFPIQNLDQPNVSSNDEFEYLFDFN